jgi:dTDP-4-dehydrorhamnose 3,5-epimerase
MGALQVIEGKLPGVRLIQPRAFPDARGFFAETYHADKYREAGIDRVFVQDNFSFSKKHVLRGLHFQSKYPQGKLVYVVQGEIFDVAVDIRHGSPSFGHWEAHTLSGENHHQLYVPEGFAHGFAVVSDTAAVMYKCTDIYRPGDDCGVRWNDPNLGIDWPVDAPLLSEKDANLPALSDMDESMLPTFE